MTLTNIFYQNHFFSISYYTLCFLLALISIFLIAHYNKKSFGLSSQTVTELALILVASGLLGGRIGHILFYDWAYFSARPWEVFALWQGGLASFGAFALGGVGLYIYSGKRDWLLYCDFVALLVPIAIFFVRIGNFFNHEIVGKNFYDLLPTMLVSSGGKVERIVPIALFEALFCGVFLFVFLMVVYRKLPRGMLTVYFLFGYSIMRFFLEFFKLDEKIAWGLNISQFFSWVLLIWSIVLYARVKKTKSLHSK